MMEAAPPAPLPGAKQRCRRLAVGSKVQRTRQEKADRRDARSAERLANTSPLLQMRSRAGDQGADSSDTESIKCLLRKRGGANPETVAAAMAQSAVDLEAVVAPRPLPAVAPEVLVVEKVPPAVFPNLWYSPRAAPRCRRRQVAPGCDGNSQSLLASGPHCCPRCWPRQATSAGS